MKKILKIALTIAHFVTCCIAWCVGDYASWAQYSIPFVVNLNERIDCNGSC